MFLSSKVVIRAAFSCRNLHWKWCANKFKIIRYEVNAIRRAAAPSALPFASSGTVVLGFGLFFKRNKLEGIDKPELNVETVRINNELKKVVPESIFKRVFNSVISFFLLVFRGIQLMAIFSPVIFTYPLLFWNSRLKRLWWKMFMFSTNMAGSICIKFAQWASTRRDIFSADFCNNFSTLHRRTAPHSWKFTKFRLEQAFGKKWRDIFVKFDNNRYPVGSGCVAQVYKAYMKLENIQDDLLSEINEMSQDSDSYFNFYEGAEVVGFGHIYGTGDKELDEAEEERRKLRISRDIDRIRIEHEQEQLSFDKTDMSDEDLMAHSKSLLDEKLNEIDPNSDDLDNLVPVAIKVLHPNIHSRFTRDLKIMKCFAKFIQFVAPSTKWLSLTECLNLFEETMMGQLDMKKEAAHMDKFRDNFQNIGNVRFASPIWPYITRNVLVQTYEDAEPLCSFMLSDYDDPEFASSELKSKIAEIGINALFKMIFEDNQVHGDLHPGNILIQNYEPYVGPDSSKEDQLIMLDMCDTLIVKPKTEKFQKLRVLILDCGIASQLDENDKNKLQQLFSAVVLRQHEKVSDMFLRHSEYDASDETTIQNFRKQMKKIIKNFTLDQLTLGTTDVGHLLSEVFSLLYSHKIKLDGNFASIMLAILVIEGVGRTLDPNIDIIEMAKPYILK